MKLSSKAENILTQISDKNTKLGDLRKIGNGIVKDHKLALELWSTQQFLPRQLAILIFDKKELSEDVLNQLDIDINEHKDSEKLQLMDWLMANQLTKDKQTIAIVESWENSPSPLQRRTFWYYQARLRWVRQKPPQNSAELLSKIENRIEKEVPEVQWAMNFLAAQIGIFEEEYRQRCIKLGEETGLYKDERVAKNCTPNYLPAFINIQLAKLNK